MVYRVTGYTAFGCTLTDSVRVNIIQPSTVVAPPDDSVCYAMGIRLNATGTEVYSWSPSTGLSDTNIPNPLARPASSITYTVTGSDRRGCFVTTDTVHVTVFPIPQLDIGRDTTISVGASLPIHAQVSADVLSIQWKPAPSLSCVDCLDPVVKPSTSTTYQATVTNDGGCTTMDEISVSVICNKANIFMPNTFSPNGDGMNDTYYPRGHGVQAIRFLRSTQPGAEAMVISVLADDQTVIEAIEAGATGYLLKDSDPINVIDAISELLEGGSPISSTIARTIVRRLGGRPSADSLKEDSGQ